MHGIIMSFSDTTLDRLKANSDGYNSAYTWYRSRGYTGIDEMCKLILKPMSVTTAEFEIPG